MKQQPELQLERAEAMLYDLPAQTGLSCPACHQSWLSLTHTCPVQPVLNQGTATTSL